jgi:PAS domain S-box-containing protein
VYFRDITREKRAELALRDSEERFRATFEQAPVGIGHVDREGRWIHVNQRLCEILGFERHELSTAKFDARTLQGDLNVDLEAIDRTLRSDAQIHDLEKRYVRKNGDVIWCHIRLSVVRDIDQAPKYFIALIEDISACKEAEAVMDSIGHELRLPLSHIKGFVSSLQRTDLEWDPVTRKDFVVEIDREADRLASLIDDLLERAHGPATGPRSRRQRAPTRPYELVVAGLDRVRTDVGDRPIEVDVPASLPRVEVDAHAIERVLANLLHNAAKYSPAGSPIRVSASTVGETLELRVDDRGPGVPPKDLDRVFEPYYRRHSATQSGRGLGLAICRSIVTAHGGRIWMVQRPGGGLRVAVALPLRRPSAGSRRGQRTPTRRRGRVARQPVGPGRQTDGRDR